MVRTDITVDAYDKIILIVFQDANEDGIYVNESESKINNIVPKLVSPSKKTEQKYDIQTDETLKHSALYNIIHHINNSLVIETNEDKYLSKENIKSPELNKKMKGLTTIFNPPLTLNTGYDTHNNSIDWCVTAGTNQKEDISKQSRRK